jgi:acyl-CoA synthetase (AMP-forming)/AMP-acid ligase II
MLPPRNLWQLAAAAGLPGRTISDAVGRVALADLTPAPPGLEGASVLLLSRRQLPAARALLALDGVARRILLCPPDAAPEHLAAIIAEAAVDTVLTDDPASAPPNLRTLHIDACAGTPPTAGPATEWILFTSGTTGRPKLVQHSLASLTGPLVDGPTAVSDAIWSTFYDIRRYGGLQILLRALIGGGSLVLSQAHEPIGAFLTRAANAGVTHLLGTPTHWRRALMSPELPSLAPRYVRLYGEVADQAVLDQLARAFPTAGLTHAYASTEAGVGFEVTDRLEGFPPSVLGIRGDFELRVVDGSLRIRSSRGAARYLGSAGLADPDGFIDTGDMVTERDGRLYFAGRRSGVINVGGQKVHPEEVEAVITRHPGIRMAQVRGRKSPITGTLVVADIVLQGDAPFDQVRDEVLTACRAALPPHKVPAMIRAVPDLAVADSGKLARASCSNA